MGTWNQYTGHILGWWIYGLCCFYEKCIQDFKQATHKQYFGRLTPANILSEDFRLTCIFHLLTVWVRLLTAELFITGLKTTAVLEKVQLGYFIPFSVLLKKWRCCLFSHWQIDNKWKIPISAPVWDSK